MTQEVPTDLVITLLGTHVQPRSRSVWAGGLVGLLGEFGISPGAARVALTRLAARDMLARTKRGRLAHYTLTSRSTAILQEGDGRIFSLGISANTEGERASPPSSTVHRTHELDVTSPRGLATNRWTVLWHTVPDGRRVERTRLTRRLRFLGFGPVQDGTWLAPRDREREVAALLDELGVGEHAGVMLGAPAASLDFRSFVGRVWDLDELARRYRRFVDDYCPFAGADLDDREALVLRTRLIHTFRQFPFLDPELPEELVAAPPHRAEAVGLFHDLYDALAPAAQRHFEEVTTP
jgi:phenylacetic acid degradation operon negative regulatory protein